MANDTTIKALYLIQKGEYQKAAQITTKQIEGNGLINSPLYNARGLVYLNTHNPYRASLDFERAILLDSKNPVFHINNALAYSDLNKTDDSMNELRKSVDDFNMDRFDRYFLEDILDFAIKLAEKSARYEDSFYFSEIQEKLREEQ
ncbi:hypothetical protein GF361_00525 [Candidatus Woesearchaeota archaeon]|nr:hypothetical protein [Candidatus Woesearchaeota archaeon]